MLDGHLRRVIDPVLDRLSGVLAASGASPIAVTTAGLALGLAAAVAIASGAMLTGLVLILVSRLADGLDGQLARRTGRTSDLGGYLDIVFDYIFYGAIPLAFALANPAANALAAAVLLTAFYANCASFLAYAAIAEKRRMSGAARGPKSFYFTTGLAEASETLIAFALFCLFPASFALIAYVFAALCAWTAGARIVDASRRFTA